MEIISDSEKGRLEIGDKRRVGARDGGKRLGQMNGWWDQS